MANPNIAQILQNGQAMAMPQWRQGAPVDFSAPLQRFNQNTQNAYAIRQERLKNAIDQLAKIGQDHLAAGRDSEAHDVMRQFFPIMNERYGTNMVGPEGFFRKDTPASAGVQRHGTDPKAWEAFQIAQKNLTNPEAGTTKEQWQGSLDALRKIQPGIGEWIEKPQAAKTEYDKTGMENYFNVGHRPEYKQTAQGGFLFTTRDGKPVGDPRELPMTAEERARLLLDDARFRETGRHNSATESETGRYHDAQIGNMNTDNSLAATLAASLMGYRDRQATTAERNSDTAAARAAGKGSGAKGAFTAKDMTNPKTLFGIVGEAPLTVPKFDPATAEANARQDIISGRQKYDTNFMSMTPDQEEAYVQDKVSRGRIGYESSLRSYNAAMADVRKRAEATLKEQGFIFKGGQWVPGSAGSGGAPQVDPNDPVGKAIIRLAGPPGGKAQSR